MITIEELKNNGADVETGLARCAKNEALYLKLINMGLGDQKFEELGTALTEKLRNKENADYSSMYSEITSIRNKFWKS